MYIIGKFGKYSDIGYGVFIFDVTAIHLSTTQTEWKVNEILYSEEMDEVQKKMALRMNWDLHDSIEYQTKNELIKAVFIRDILFNEI